jgi:hypothetical protein
MALHMQFLFLIGQFFLISSETAWPINWNMAGSIYGMSSYEDCSFRPDRLSNMATTGNSSFWLVDI